jgi:uncharacterized repeat protein (TIGR03803 family)
MSSNVARAILVFVIGFGTTLSLEAQTYTTLHSFRGRRAGTGPVAVILDSAGNLYGTTLNGGVADAGTVFRLNTLNQKAVLYRFMGGADGANPEAGVVRDAAGNLYGTTLNGGSSDAGTVFKVDTHRIHTVLYSFTGGVDGRSPWAGLVLDSLGNLYGTTVEGGAHSGGTVFMVNPSGHETVLYSFSRGNDGWLPSGGLIRDSSGNLYGTTQGGGPANEGTVFKLDSTGNKTVLYSFTGGNDGGTPVGGLILDAVGNLYGTTYYGGSSQAGTVYRIAKSGNQVVLYSFTGGVDGARPSGSLKLGSNGKLYGTTYLGGASGVGTVFSVDSSSKGHETVLHSFAGGVDGAAPGAELALDPAGNIYGTAGNGGTYGYGVVFKLVP